MSLSELAHAVTAIEGGAVNLPIAQVREVIRAIQCVAASLPCDERLRLAARLVATPKPKRGGKR
jgi:hypothetical protein